MAKERIYGGFRDSYDLLPGYVEMIKTTSPGSYCLVTWSEVVAGKIPHFKAYFISFACILLVRALSLVVTLRVTH